MANQVVTRSKIIRLCSLAKNNRLSLAVDNEDNVDALSEAVIASGVSLQVLVEVDAGFGRCGVGPGQPALDLAKHVVFSPGLSFGGLMATLPAPNLHNGDGADDNSSAPDRQTMESKTRDNLQPVVNTRELIEKNGLPVPSVSVAGTHCYDIAGQWQGLPRFRPVPIR